VDPERETRPDLPEDDHAGDVVRARREALSPQVDEFLIWATQMVDPQNVPHFVELGGLPIELGSWEREALQKGAEAAAAEIGRTMELLAEGVAIQQRYVDLIGRFEHGPMPPPSELPAFLEDLVTSLAVGIAVQDELQFDMNSLIGGGRLADAKCLSRFRAKVAQGVSDLKERVGAVELEQAERRAAGLTGKPPKDTTPVFIDDMPLPEPAALREQEPEAPSWARRGSESTLPPWLADEAAAPESASQTEVPAPEARPRRLLKPMLHVLAGLVVVLALVTIPRMGSPEIPPVLTMKSFSHLEAVRRVAARPPSLYVVLDGPLWQDKTPEEKTRLLEEIGQIADQAGYNGMRARVRDAGTVGEWLKKTGVRVTEQSGSPS
jgi:hypothetical protein